MNNFNLLVHFDYYIYDDENDIDFVVFVHGVNTTTKWTCLTKNSKTESYGSDGGTEQMGVPVVVMLKDC